MKRFDFRVYESDLEDFLDIKTNVSEFIRQTLDDLRTGKLSYDNSDDNIDLQIKQKRLEKLNADLKIKNDDEYCNAKRELTISEAKIAKYHADNLDVIGSRPSRTAKKAMNHYVNAKPRIREEVQRKYKIDYFSNEQLPYKALCLVSGCEVLFEGTDRQEVTDDVCWHIEEIHNMRPEIVVTKN